MEDGLDFFLFFMLWDYTVLSCILHFVSGSCFGAVGYVWLGFFLRGIIHGYIRLICLLSRIEVFMLDFVLKMAVGIGELLLLSIKIDLRNIAICGVLRLLADSGCNFFLF